MKRAICILLAAIFALSLASCGTKEECTYDFLPSDYPLFVRISQTGLPIKGGAYLNIDMHNLDGKGLNDTENEIPIPMRSIFDEETKTIIPLCWDMTCEHGNENCFGYLYGASYYAFTGIYDDTVFLLRESADTKNQLEAVYYGLDGVILETIEYSPELIMPNGEILEDRFFMNPMAYFLYGSKFYFDICTEFVGADKAVLLEQYEVEYVHWFVSYDIELKKWELLTKEPYLFYDNSILFGEAQENKLAFTHNGIGYVVDAETGETEIYDCAEILDKMIADGKIPVGTKITGTYVFQDYFICYTGSEILYCKISTQDFVEYDELERVSSGVRYRYVYNGELYVIDSTKTPDNYISMNKNTGEKFSFGIDGKVLGFFSETEKGIIFSYLNLFEDENGLSLEPETYTVKENGRDVTYRYPKKYVYVTKEDILDGQIDEPWYYDAETYSFVQK